MVDILFHDFQTNDEFNQLYPIVDIKVSENIKVTSASKTTAYSVSSNIFPGWETRCLPYPQHVENWHCCKIDINKYPQSCRTINSFITGLLYLLTMMSLKNGVVRALASELRSAGSIPCRRKQVPDSTEDWGRLGSEEEEMRARLE